jgi:hypothetical protein
MRSKEYQTMFSVKIGSGFEVSSQRDLLVRVGRLELSASVESFPADFLSPATHAPRVHVVSQAKDHQRFREHELSLLFYRRWSLRLSFVRQISDSPAVTA